MTVKEFLDAVNRTSQILKPEDGGPSFEETALSAARLWSNAACEGYVRVAAELMNIDPEDTKAIVRELHHAFDDLTVEEAELVYRVYNNAPV